MRCKHAGRTPHLLPALPAATDCWKKEEVEEEEKRLRELRLRENLIRNLGVAKQLYNMFHDAASSRQADAPLSVLTESHLLLSRRATMLEPLGADGRTLQLVPTLNVSTECGTDSASLNPLSDCLPPTGSRSKPRSEQSPHHQHHQQHQQLPISTEENPQPVTPPGLLDSQDPLAPDQAKSDLYIRAQYQPHPQVNQSLFGPLDTQGRARPQVPTPGQTHQGRPLRQQSSSAALLNGCAVQSSVTMKASEIHDSLPTSVSLCKLESSKNNWPFAERRSRGHTYSWQPSQMCHSAVYSDLHIVSGPAPINKRPNQCPIRHSETPRCGRPRAPRTTDRHRGGAVLTARGSPPAELSHGESHFKRLKPQREPGRHDDSDS